MKRSIVMSLMIAVLLLMMVQVSVAQNTAGVREIPISSVGFGAELSPDGKTLVTFENIILLGLEEVDPTILPMRVIDISTGEQVGQLTGYSDYTSDVVFTSDGSRMISLHENGDLIIWDMATLEAVQTIETLVMGSMQLMLLPDDHSVILRLNGIPQRIAVLDLETGAITHLVGQHFDSFLEFRAKYTQMPDSGSVQYAAIELSPDGTQIATSTFNDELGLWTVEDNAYTLLQEPSEQFGLFSIRNIKFTPDGDSLVYFDTRDDQTHVRDVDSGSEKAVLPMGSDTFSLSPDGTKMVWVTRVKDDVDTVSVGSLDAPDSSAVILTLPEDLQVASRITWATFTPDGQQVVVGGFFAQGEGENTIYVIDVP